MRFLPVQIGSFFIYLILKNADIVKKLSGSLDDNYLI
jgi:hypothetical protein